MPGRLESGALGVVSPNKMLKAYPQRAYSDRAGPDPTRPVPSEEESGQRDTWGECRVTTQAEAEGYGHKPRDAWSHQKLEEAGSLPGASGERIAPRPSP